MSTIDKIGAYDALEKAAPGEPMFPLLARDVAAPATITEWCRLRRNRAYKLYGDTSNPREKILLAAELEQCANAEQIAIDFQAWRESHNQDGAQPGERASYQEIVRTAEEIAESARRKKREDLCRFLREAAAYVCDAADGFSDLGFPETSDQLRDALGTINAIADQHEAKRPQYAAEPTLPLAEQSSTDARV